MDLDALLHPENAQGTTEPAAITPVVSTAPAAPATPAAPSAAPIAAAAPVAAATSAPAQAPEKKEIPVPIPETLVRHTSHTYADDLSKAMDTTEASVVQDLLTNAREREDSMNQKRTADKERQWYSVGAAVLLLSALCAAGYAIIYLQSLTVPVQKEVSIGVFPTTVPIVIGTTDIRKVIASSAAGTELPQNKPFLLNIVKDPQSLTPLSDDETLAFMESSPAETLRGTLKNIHIGGYVVGKNATSFIIVGVEDREAAAKELLSNEPELLQDFYKTLSIPIDQYANSTTQQFKNSYTYNIAIRSLSLANKTTRKSEMVIYYGYVTDNILVIASNPMTIKAVYDTVVRQQ